MKMDSARLHAALTLFDRGIRKRRAEAERISKPWLIPLADVARLSRRLH